MPGKQPFFCDHIAVANPARQHANSRLSRSGLWNVTLDDFEISPGFGYLYSFHLWHSILPPSPANDAPSGLSENGLHPAPIYGLTARAELQSAQPGLTRFG